MLHELFAKLNSGVGIKGDSSWDTVDKLEGEGIINSQAALNLKNAITFATTLRLKTYAHHKAQKEDMSIFVKPTKTDSELKEQDKQIFHLSEEDLGEQGGLFQYFYTVLPLHEKLKEFCSKHKDLNKASKEIFFQNTEFYNDDGANKGLIHYRLAQYKEAQYNLEDVLENQKNQGNLPVRKFLGRIYDSFGNAVKAIEQFQYCVKHSKYLPDVADYLNALGLVYKTKGDYDQAIKCHNESLKMRKAIYGEKESHHVADSLNNLGLAYKAKGQYDQAIKCHKERLKMRKLIYKEEPHPDIAMSLDNLGAVYYAKGDYDQAIKYHEDCLKINKRLYKKQPHSDVAMSLNNLGTDYEAKGDYDQAINYHNKSLERIKLIYQNEPHRDVAIFLKNLGFVYAAKRDYDKAINYHEQSLNMRKSIYKDQPHPDVASSLNNLGLTYKAKEDYDQAIKYYKKSLDMYKLIYEEPHQNVAGSLNNLGLTYMAKGQYDQAIKYLEESLDMYKLIYKEEHHPDIARSLHSLGFTYEAKGQYDQAIKYNSQALQIMSAFQDHPDTIINIKNNLIKTAVSFAKKYSLNPQEIENKILSFASQGLDFTDYQLHFALALLQENSNESGWQVITEILEEYRLALIFLPREEAETKLEIYNKLRHAIISGFEYMVSIFSGKADIKLTNSATTASSANMDDIDVTLLADIDLSATNQDLPSL